MGHNARLDYEKYTKRGFLLGLALFLLGAAGSSVGTGLAAGLPNWELTMFFDLMVVGVAVGFVAVFVFGIFLPLTD